MSTSHSKVSKLVLLILTLQILIKTDEKFDYGVINGDLETRTSGSSSWKTLFLVFRVYFRKTRLELGQQAEDPSEVTAAGFDSRHENKDAENISSFSEFRDLVEFEG